MNYYLKVYAKTLLGKKLITEYKSDLIDYKQENKIYKNTFILFHNDQNTWFLCKCFRDKKYENNITNFVKSLTHLFTKTIKIEVETNFPLLFHNGDLFYNFLDKDLRFIKYLINRKKLNNTFQNLWKNSFKNVYCSNENKEELLKLKDELLKNYFNFLKNKIEKDKWFLKKQVDLVLSESYFNFLLNINDYTYLSWKHEYKIYKKFLKKLPKDIKNQILKIWDKIIEIEFKEFNFKKPLNDWIMQTFTFDNHFWKAYKLHSYFINVIKEEFQKSGENWFSNIKDKNEWFKEVLVKKSISFENPIWSILTLSGINWEFISQKIKEINYQNSNEEEFYKFQAKILLFFIVYEEIYQRKKLNERIKNVK